MDLYKNELDQQIQNTRCMYVPVFSDIFSITKAKNSVHIDTATASKQIFFPLF